MHLQRSKGVHKPECTYSDHSHNDFYAEKWGKNMEDLTMYPNTFYVEGEVHLCFWQLNYLSMQSVLSVINAEIAIVTAMDVADTTHRHWKAVWLLSR